MSDNIGPVREMIAKWYYKDLWGWDLDKICGGNIRSTFLKSLLVCANGDGRLTPEEKDWVIGRAAVAGAPESLLEELRNYSADEDITEVISRDLATNQSRRAVVYFAFKAALADKDLSRDEISQIYQTGQALGISEETLWQIEEQVREEEYLKEKRIRLCFPNGNPFGL
jgi:uncharacterized membrane protein YebE (DUF533 family)